MTVLPGRLGPPLSRPPSLFPIPPLSTSVRLRLRRLPSLSVSVSAADPNPSSFSPEYLVHSCGLSSDEAVRAYNKIQHLKSPDKPDAVLRFLRDIGISESDIRRTVSRDAWILCSNVEKNLRPNVKKLQEVALSIDDISYILSHNPNLFRFNFAPKIDFWLGFLGSAENFSVFMRRCGVVLGSNLEKAVLPKLCFLKDDCGLSSSRIVRLIKSCPRLLTSNIETLKMNAQRADQLGIARSTGTFVEAMIIVTWLNQQTVDARLNNLISLGFSQEEVTQMIGKAPNLLAHAEEAVSKKMEFLLKKAGCDKNDIVRYPVMLKFSLENRLIPRNVVRKLLMSKGFPPKNYKLVSLVIQTEKQFVDKYVLPNEHAIPGLHRAYADARARKNVAID